MTIKDILNIDEAAELLGVSIKTFNKVLHNESLPARKIGREWKFSRAALIAWVGNGRSQDFYNADRDDDAASSASDHGGQSSEITPAARGTSPAPGVDSGVAARSSGAVRTRRTAGWQIEMD